jgi:hypothetical protein
VAAANITIAGEPGASSVPTPAELLAAERKANTLLAATEARHPMRPDRSETEVDRDTYTLAETEIGVTQHWQQRIVRVARKTVCIFAENPPVRVIAAGHDTVFSILGRCSASGKPISAAPT